MVINSNSKADLSNPVFNDMKEKLNAAFRNAISGMNLRNLASGVVTLKIDITTDRTSVKDKNAPIGSREALKLKINYRIATDMRATSNTKGDVFPKTRTYELVQDDTKAFFILTSEEASGQLNMFNGYDELPKDEAPASDDDDPLEDEDLDEAEDALDDDEQEDEDDGE